MGTVKYSGPVASFHCPTEATIRSLKVHFSPKQLGEGTPSPENVREIVGWDGVTIQKSGVNLFNPNTEWVVQSGRYYSRFVNNDTALFRMDLIEKNTTADVNGCFIGFALDPSNIELGYCWALRNGTVRPTANRTNRAGTNPLQYLSIYPSTIETLTKILARYDVRIVLNDVPETAPFKPYQDLSTINYEFGVLGKNKLNADAEQQAPSDTTSLPTTKRIFMPNTYCVGMSWSNYYFPNNVTSYSVSNGTIAVTNGNVYGLGYPVRVTPGQAYFLSATVSESGRAHIAYFAADGTYVGGVSTNTMNKSFTVPNGVETAVIVFYSSSGEATFSNIQLELGFSATTYEPYNPNKTVYGGWVDLVSGEVAEEWYNVSGSDLTWMKRTGYNFANFQAYTSPTGDGSIPHNSIGVYSDIYESRSWNAADTGEQSKYVWLYSGGRIYIKDPAIVDYTVEEFNEYIKGAQFVYILETPITYHIAPVQLQTFLSKNNIWSNADYVEVEYDLHETQEILNRKQFIIANQPHIEKLPASPLQNFSTNVAAPLKECKVYFEPKQDLHGYDKPWVGGSGKNLFNPNCEMWNYSVYTKDGNNITQSGSDGRGWTNANFIPLHLTAGTYTISCSDGNNFSYATSLDEFVTPATLTNGGGTFTLSEDCDVKIKHSVKTGNSYPTTFTVQLEEGSTATSYEPYENICPISGWTGLKVHKTGKSIAQFVRDSITPSIYYNGYSGWCNETPIDELLLNKQVTYSAYIDCTGKESIAYECLVKVWAHYKNGGYAIHVGNQISAGSSGISKTTFAIYDTYDWVAFGLSLDIGVTASNPMVECDSVATEYESYNGTTIPITFPSVTNLLNSTTITANKTLSATGEETTENGMSLTDYIKVNEGDTYKLTFTSKEGARTRRIYGYDVNKEPVESLAVASWVSVDTAGSIQATIPSGVEYIRICYKTADENIFLEGPESSVIHGGYVDLVTGEVWKEWELVDLATIPWGLSSNRARYDHKGYYEATAYNIAPLAYAEKYKGVSASTFVTAATFAITGSTIIFYYDGKNKPSGNIALKLATPQLVTTLSSTQLKTLRGVNNVWSNAGDVELSYWKN